MPSSAISSRNCPAVWIERHAHILGAGVKTGVVQRFLNDAKNRTFQGGCQTFEMNVVRKLHVADELANFVDQILDAGHHSRFVEDRRPQAAEQPPGFAHRLAQKPHAVFELLTCPGRRRVGRLGRGFQVHQRAGHLLAEAVVDFIGEQLPFALVDIEQLPQQALLAAQCLLDAFALGNIADRRRQIGWGCRPRPNGRAHDR